MALQFLVPLIGSAIDYFKDKQELKAVERQNKIEAEKAIGQARLENIKQGKINEAEWNLTSIRNAGWKDELLTLILSIPLVLVFIPAMVPHMLAGFEALEQTPLWYRSAVGVMIASAFGYRKLTQFFNDKKYR